MNYDITFCSNKKCKNKECERNQNNLDAIEYKRNHIWIGDFKNCEYWSENNDEYSGTTETDNK